MWSSARKRFADLPIRQKLRLAIVGTTLVTLLLVIVTFSLFEWYAVREQIQQDLSIRAQIIGSNSVAALAFSDFAAANETLQALRAAPDVQLSCIYVEDETRTRLFAAYLWAESGIKCPDAPRPALAGLHADHIGVLQDISLDGEKLGELYMRADLSQLWERLWLVGEVSMAVLAASGILALVLSGFLQSIISSPLLALARVADKVSSSRDYSLRATKAGEDEVGHLIDSFNEMLGQIGLRDTQLRQTRDDLAIQVSERERANAELKKAMDRLEETQDQLVQTEKMASLGALVAGVAHEINTPVGIGVTAASTLKIKSEELARSYQSGKISRSLLDEYTDIAVNSTQMILNNLERAAELIQSFKQVAVDQSSAEKRSFNLRTYIEEVLLSLRPQLKRSRHSVQVDCPDDIMMNSYPGALSQVLTNLVMNSLTHAFDEGDIGEMTIRAATRGKSVQIVYSDNGCGIPPEHVDKIFDPFFTTKRGSGGSGLGLHIVFNLVTNTLKGTIKLDRAAGEGTAFILTLPLEN